MLINQNSSNNSIFSSEVVKRCGMSSDGIFQVVGTAPEPKFAWNPEEQKFTDIVSGYGVWVRQDYKQFRQNPILVIIPHLSQKKAESFNFGQNVKFKNLGGYYSRKNRIFKWQADSINKVEEDEK